MVLDIIQFFYSFLILAIESFPRSIHLLCLLAIFEPHLIYFSSMPYSTMNSDPHQYFLQIIQTEIDAIDLDHFSIHNLSSGCLIEI